MKESFETSDFRRSEHFTTVPFLSEINKRPIVSIKSCVSSRVKGLCYPNCLNWKRMRIKSLKAFRLLTHFCIHLKCQKTGTSAKATNLVERWMIRYEGTWSNDQCPRLVRLALFEVTKFRDSFFFPEEHPVKCSNWELSPWVSCLGFLDPSKKRRASESKAKFRRAVV